MDLTGSHTKIFNRGRNFENPRFWSRFSAKPNFQGAAVLEVGSGWGSLCVDIAFSGASKVVGLDLRSDLINFATQHLEQNFPELVNIIEFKDIDLKFYGNTVFDYIVSKDSFEHIINVPEMLEEMEKRLKPGGKIFIGFGPLYTSPYGDHDRRRTCFSSLGVLGKFLALIPWGHLFMESLIIKMAALHTGKDVNSMYDLDLNKMSVSDFRKAFQESGFTVIDFLVNQSSSLKSKISSLFCKIPFLQNYFTHSIYCILEKKS